MKIVKKKHAIVTGASSGIGWHISEELAAKGYSLVAISNQAQELSKLKSHLEKKHTIEVLTIDCDLTKTNAAKSIFDYCQEKNLLVEVLVNNAGILVHGEVMSIDFRRAKSILQLHMNTPVALCRLFGKEMVKNQTGYILNVSSISAVMPYPIISLYGPTKTFLRQFSRALRIEMKESKVYVSCLLPGATATPLYDEDKVNIPLAKKLGVMKSPDYVAKAGINALFKGKGESVPGLLNKFTMLFIPLVPLFIISFIYKMYKKRIAKQASTR